MSAITKLGQAGVQVKTAQPEKFGDLQDYVDVFRSIMNAIGSYNSQATVSDYLGWFGQRQLYRFALSRFFQDWDILLAPANITNAFPHVDGQVLTINDEDADYNLQIVYPSLCNLSGHPGTAFPVGLTQAGLPIGLQAIGPYLEDRTTIRFAELVAQEFGGFQVPIEYGEYKS